MRLQLDNSVGGVVGEAAHVLISSDFHVAVFSPVLSPPVLQNPVFGRVADGEHRVVDG